MFILIGMSFYHITLPVPACVIRTELSVKVCNKTTQTPTWWWWCWICISTWKTDLSRPVQLSHQAVCVLPWRYKFMCNVISQISELSFSPSYTLQCICRPAFKEDSLLAEQTQSMNNAALWKQANDVGARVALLHTHAFSHTHTHIYTEPVAFRGQSGNGDENMRKRGISAFFPPQLLPTFCELPPLSPRTN